MRTTGDASPASLAADPKPRPTVRVADAAYGCVDWFLYEEPLLAEAAAAVAERARLAARLPALPDSATERRCA